MAAVSSTYLCSLNSACEGVHCLLSTAQKHSNLLTDLLQAQSPPRMWACTLAQLPTSCPGCACRETGLFQFSGWSFFCYVARRAWLAYQAMVCGGMKPAHGSPVLFPMLLCSDCLKKITVEERGISKSIQMRGKQICLPVAVKCTEGFSFHGCEKGRGDMICW